MLALTLVRDDILKTLRFVFDYAKKYVKQLIVAMLAMVGLVGVQLLGPQIIRRLIAMISQGGWDAAAQSEILMLAVGILVIYLLRSGMRFVSNYMSHVAGWGVVADSRRAIYAHLQRLSLRFYEDQQVGELMSRMVNDSDKFERLISHAVPDTIVNVLMLFGVMAVMLSMNWQLMLLTVIPVPFIVLAMQGFGKYVRPAFRERQQDLAELNASINDNLTGIREIKTFTREGIEGGRIGKRIDAYRDSMLRALRLMAIFGPFVEFSSSMGTIIVIYFGGRLAFQRVLPIEDLVAFFLYLDMFYQPVRMLSNVWENVQEALAGAERVAELLDEAPDIDDKPDAIVLPGHVRGAICFEDVHFSYDRGDPVLEGVNLDIPATTVVALVGPTGVGKTTLASLIPRFYDVRQGAITLDGHDIRDLSVQSLRRQIAMVLQDVFLFHGSVRDNILFGRPDATEEEVIEAAKIANAHEFILALPDGYDTTVGERGMKLSGGQKQRVSIARAVLKDAPILILDEATSSVDTETELLIQQALERLIKGRTTIIIAHRLSTVRNADLIAVLEGTGISELGNHAQLINRGGLYSHLWDIQGQVLSGDPMFASGGQTVGAFRRN